MGRMWLLFLGLTSLLPGAGEAQGSTVPRALVGKASKAVKAVKAKPPSGTPRTPKDLPACTQTLIPEGHMPRRVGEAIRYHVDVDGLSVGVVDFKIERQGQFAGQAVTEYRSQFKIDSLVAALLPVEGRAASLVPTLSHSPTVAMSRYRLKDKDIEEDLAFSQQARAVVSKRLRNGKARQVQRLFDNPAPDFISSFYLLRSLPANMNGCTILYANQRAYTIWIQPDGEEKVETPVGLQAADRYRLRYASERSRKARTGRLWLSKGPERLPYRVEMNGKHSLVARVHMYEAGAK